MVVESGNYYSLMVSAVYCLNGCNLNYFDIIPLVVILLFAGYTYCKGFIKSTLMLIVWGSGLAMGIGFHPAMANWLQLNFSINPQWLRPLAFGLLFCMGAMLGYTLAFFIKKRVPVEVHAKITNKIFGIVPGLVMGWLVALMVTKVASVSTLPSFSTAVQESYFAAQSGDATRWWETEFTAVFSQPTEKTMPAKEAAIVAGAAEFKNSHYVRRPDLEQAMLGLVNAERRKRLLKPLRADAILQKLAAQHAADMFVRGYFSHQSPEGLDPFARMKQAGIHYRTAGENLAHANSLPSAHQALMQSPTHRANILNPRFGQLGIAILEAGEKGLMFVQEFRD